MSSVKPLPPYARNASVVGEAVWIRCGRAGWDFLRKHPDSGEMVWPGDALPDAHSWAFVKGLDVYLVCGDCPRASCQLIVDELLANGATAVRAIDWPLIGGPFRGVVTFER